MNMMERLAASRAKINAMKEQMTQEPVQSVPDNWTATDRVTRGKPVYIVYAIFKKVNPVRAILDALPREVGEHVENGVCPHCQGRGRYSAHRGHFHNEKCYRCDGKGLLDAKDLAFLKRREVNNEPICHIVTA